MYYTKVNGKFLKFDHLLVNLLVTMQVLVMKPFKMSLVIWNSSNTESGITVTYQDADGIFDFTIGTLNQDTTGNGPTATALETARNIGGVSLVYL